MTVAAVRRLADVRMADVAEVGGKAASLGELIAAGVRVPDGVVIAADAADMTSDERRWLSGAGAWDLGAGPFAVRSSGIAEDGAERSFAGMYESVLNVSADDVPAAVDRCLASARAARVADYEPARDGRMAVIVQRMVAAAAAGVALTADPINGDRSTCVVTAVRGLGERLVSGEALGDEWVVGEGGATARRQPEHAIDRHQAVADRHRGASHRGCPRDAAGHRVGDRCGGHAVDRPGQTDDGAAAGRVVGRAGAGRVHPHAPLRRVDRRAGHPALRVVAADGAWRTACTRLFRELIGQIAPRPYHVVVNGWYFYSINFISGRRVAAQPSEHAGDGRSPSAPPRGDHSADRSPRLSDRRADVARGPAAALPSLGRRCRAPRGEHCPSPSFRR